MDIFRDAPSKSSTAKRDSFSLYGLWGTLLLFFIYLGIVLLRPLDSFWSIDGGGKFIYMVSAITSSDLLAPIIYPQRAIDPQAAFVPIFYRIIKGDEFYTWWSPFLPMISIPFYKLIGQIGIYILPALCGALCAFFSGKITFLLRNTNLSAWLVFGAVGLSSPIAFYSQMFWEHTPSVAFLLIALYFVLKYDDSKSGKGMALSGAFASLSAAFRPELAILCFCFGIVLLIKDWRKAFFFGLGFLLMGIPWMLFNQIQSGNFLYPSVGEIVGKSSFDLIQEKGIISFISHILINSPARYGYPVSPTNQIIAAVGIFLGLAAPLFKQTHPLVIPAYLAISWVSFQLLIEPAGYQAVHGFLIIAPGVLLAVWYFKKITSNRMRLFLWILVASVVGIGVVYILKSWEAAGGLQWGPRYLLAFYPMLMIAGGVGISLTWNEFKPFLQKSLLICMIIFILIGVGFQVRGILMVRQMAIYTSTTADSVQKISDRVMLLGCDADTLVPELYWQKPVFSILRSDLKKWNEHLDKNKITSYYQIDFDFCFLAQVDQIAQYRQTNPAGIVVRECDVQKYREKNPNFCAQINP